SRRWRPCAGPQQAAPLHSYARGLKAGLTYRANSERERTPLVNGIVGRDESRARRPWDAATGAQAVARLARSGRPRTSKNRAWLMTAFTLSLRNGLAIRKVGSGRVPVRSLSG